MTVSLRADARHTGGDNSWLRAHYVDFVTVDSESGLEQFNFTALDGTNRTDYWLSNDREVTNDTQFGSQ